MEQRSTRQWRRLATGVAAHPWRSLVTVLLGSLLVAFAAGAIDRGASTSTSQAPRPAVSHSEPAGSGALRAASTTVAAGGVGGSSSAGGGGGTASALPSEAGGTASTAPGVGTAPSAASAGAAPLPPGSTGRSARIEETGSLTLVVASGRIQQDLARLTAIAAGSGGFVATSQLDTGTGNVPSQATITLQIPEAEFPAVLAQARALGKVASLNSQASDVTGQYVDLQARISALQASREQYLTIMAKATSIGDVLGVQNQLDNLQAQIEQLQGQLGVLDDQTSYATLAVTLTPKALPAPVADSGLAAAWHSAVSGFEAGFEGMVRVAGPLLFVLLLAGLIVGAGRGTWHLSRRVKAPAG
jgi:hypothetical protein